MQNSPDWSPAWMPGTQVAETTLQPGTRVRMVVDESAWKAIQEGDTSKAFGGWATFDEVPNQSYARNRLALTSDMKADVSYVVEVEITYPINAQVGVVGPQGTAAGGGNQLHFLLPKKARGSAFRVVPNGGRAIN